MRLAVFGASITLVLAIGLPSVTWSLARYTDGAGAAATFAADVLDPPVGLTVSSVAGLVATLTWTPTVDAYATGYRVYRSTTSGSGFVLVASVTPSSASTTIDTPILPGTYYYILRTFIGNWLSAPSNQVSAALL